jgi:prepilin-type N-terminal cleavage/methylation domain-containing protein
MCLHKTRGFTLVELLIGLVILGFIMALGWSGLRSFRESASLEGAARGATRLLILGRGLAVARREPVHLRAVPHGLALTAPDGAQLAGLSVGPGAEFDVDSVRIRPSALRFNTRGQAAAGSVYLWKGDTGIRLVCNFLGRVRREVLSKP